ncbi:hypothetical protein niasHS_013937 [Heterodera schachtii]|uniref:Ferric reductase NAD binding domain-containing protein n=1 Tax=Heterodera schachtii TaxID=97005 RepID=A0ABD2IP98_HETSC
MIGIAPAPAHHYPVVTFVCKRCTKSTHKTFAFNTQGKFANISARSISAVTTAASACSPACVPPTISGGPNSTRSSFLQQCLHPEVAEIGVFSCGPAQVNKQIRRACTEANRFRNAPSFVHRFETF